MEDNFTAENEDELFGPSTDENKTVEQDPALGFDETAVNPDDPDNTEDWDKETPSTEDTTEHTSDFMSDYLRARGIDKNHIQITNENGEAEDVDFDDLTDAEKLDILENSNQLPISDEEIQTLNYLRQGNMTLRDFAQWQRNDAIQQYLQQNQQVQYTVDQISDDDLYKFDLMDRYPNMTEDEAEEELTQAKANEATFNKKIQSLRTEYMQLENEQMQAEQQQAAAQADAEYNQMAQSVVESIRNIDEIHGLELEDQDKEEILSFLLDKDVNGQSKFYKLFENPDALIRLGWYALYGDQAFKDINDYYKGVIEKTRRSSQQAAPTKTVNRHNTKTKEPDPYGLNDVFK